MSPDNDLTVAPSRKLARQTAAVNRSHAASGSHWSRRRGALGVFATFATLGLAGAYLGTAGLAIANAPDAAADSPVTLYASVADASQSLVAHEDAAAAKLDRDSYTVYVTPKPTPTPEPVQESSGSSSGSSSSSSNSYSAPAAGSPNPGSAKGIAFSMVQARGWGQGEYSCLVSLWNRESGWNVYAYNRGSGAYGIPQALPGSKMASAGGDWRSSAATQIRWGLGYISARYGTPCGAWGHSNAVGWY